MLVSLKDLFLEVCAQALACQQGDGAMPAGHNGPYQDPETPVRNSSHWSIAFGKAYDLSKEEKFLRASQHALDFLLGTSEFRQGYTFKQRSKAGKDSCNGLIGPAWNIEALVFGHQRFARQEYLELAVKLFTLHPFDAKSSLWQRVDWDGRILSVDGTFNHQLWFYALSLALRKYLPISAQFAQDKFEDALVDHFAVAANGRIRHSVWSTQRSLKERLRALFKPLQSHKLELKEIGYHCFNLYAFSVVNQQRPSALHKLERKIRFALAYLSEQEFISYLQQSDYSYSYNAPGFEWPVIAAGFNLMPQLGNLAQEALRKQIILTYNQQQKRFSLNNPDPETLTARMYELVRLPSSFFQWQITSTYTSNDSHAENS